MVVFPGCKINIGLNITEKRADGYHNLESIFFPINLSDILEIVPADHFSIHTTGLNIDGDHTDNLVVKAYYLLQDEYCLPPVKIHLHKIVPMGAGLGGGSADGAFALLALNKLFNLNIPTDQLENYADQLGSDCAFFIQNKPAFIQGKGEIVQPIDFNLEGYHIYLINPKKHISTKEAFGGITPKLSTFDLKNALQKNPADWKNEIKNDFETSIFPHHPDLADIKDKLYASGALYASMTGTGSTVYGIFQDAPEPLYPSHFEWISKL